MSADDPRLQELLTLIKKGQSAALNSSAGPLMTISDIHPDGVIETVWFTEGGECRREAFNYEELKFPGIEDRRRFQKPTDQGWSA